MTWYEFIEEFRSVFADVADMHYTLYADRQVIIRRRSVGRGLLISKWSVDDLVTAKPGFGRTAAELFKEELLNWEDIYYKRDPNDRQNFKRPRRRPVLD